MSQKYNVDTCEAEAEGWRTAEDCQLMSKEVAKSMINLSTWNQPGAGGARRGRSCPWRWHEPLALCDAMDRRRGIDGIDASGWR
eukprot:8493311-Pyramimonas_sp.AAC.2